MLDTVVASGEDVCCSVVFGTLVGVFSVMWFELLMTYTEHTNPVCYLPSTWSVFALGHDGHSITVKTFICILIDPGMSLNCVPTLVCRKTTP